MSSKIGKRIYDLRKKNGMTLESLGNAVGTGKQTIKKYEDGTITNIPSDKIEKLAKALHTTPAYLMGWESEEEIEKEVNKLTDSQARFMAYYLGLSKDKQEKIEQMAKLIGE